MGERLAGAAAAPDIQTGGGEVLAGVPRLPPLTAATESWPPDAARATALLYPRGAVVVADADEPPLPFADDRCRDRLRALYERITAEGPLAARSSRMLVEARKPAA